VEGSIRARWNREKVLAHDERLPLPWERLAARLIDQAFILLVAGVILAIGLIIENSSISVLGFVTYLGAAPVYEIACTARWGQTLGKRMKHLRVVDVDNGELPGVMQSILRWLVYVLAFWAAYSVMINRTHRGPHDRLAHTVVVYSD